MYKHASMKFDKFNLVVNQQIILKDLICPYKH